MRQFQAHRPKRYWPGKAPVEAIRSSSDEDNDEGQNHKNGNKSTYQALVFEKKDTQGSSIVETKEKKHDQISSENDDDVTSSLGGGSDLSDNELEERRDRLRKRLLTREANEIKDVISSGEDYDEELSLEEENSSESEDDVYKPPQLFRPSFTSKESRSDGYNTELLKAKESLEKIKLEKELEARKEQARTIISEELKREKLLAEAEKTQRFKDVDDTDLPNDELEYSKWKIRELARLKRNEETAARLLEEKTSAEARKNLTNEEIEAEKAKEGRLLNQKKKSKLKFLQRYYHKGVFFVDEGRTGELLASRDFNVPTLEDKFDKTSVPKVMQVKNFGRSGRVKYTHLTDQDTSKAGKNWYNSRKDQEESFKKLGGYSSDFSRPSHKKKKMQ